MLPATSRAPLSSEGVFGTLAAMSATASLNVWVLAGQSNMQGYGWRRGALAPDPRVRLFSSAGNWENAAEPLHRLWESYTPVHQDLMRLGMTEAERAMTDAELAAREADQGTTG